MNLAEYLFTKLTEECNEVGQRVSKLLCFGQDEAQLGQPNTNAQRLSRELDDVMAVLALLREFDIFDYKPDLAAQERKRAKLIAYMVYSRQLGRLSDDPHGPPTRPKN